MLREGVLLGKRYEIQNCIGSGGMADVYKGKDHKLDRLVAIKVLKSDFRTDEVFIKKFLSEAQAAAGLMHPNVVNVYDVGQDRGLYYMVMELVEGITLKDYIQRKGRLSPKETISISIQMVNGIQAAHNKNIVHRDIKPQNIIISKDGKVKVTDFGIARATTSTQTVSSSVMGSVHYTSPEHARGEVVNEKSDIYSAGITMYEMVTGHVPFDGDSTVTVALKHLQDQIVSPAEYVPDIPYSLECIIMKCTAKNPLRRYQDSQSLIADLKRSLTDPDGDFVFSGGAATRSSDRTVLMSTGELDQINQARGGRPISSGGRQNQNYKKYKDDYDDYDDYDDDYDDDDDNDDYQDPDDAYRRPDGDPNTQKIMKILKIVVIAIIAIGAIAIGGWALNSCEFGTGDDETIREEETLYADVPDLVGLTLNQARDLVRQMNEGYQARFNVTVDVADRVYSDRYDRDVIISQQTRAGTEVERPYTIYVVISLGEETIEVTMPNVNELSEEEARRIIEELNLVVGNVATAYDENIPEGYVISTNPSAGAVLEEGARVNIVLSRGSDRIEVPNLVRMTRSSAESALRSAGLLVGTPTEEFDDEIPVGAVISQSIPPGERVARNTTVYFVISRGPEPPEMVAVPNLSGRTEAEARALIEGAGLTVGSVASEYHGSVIAGNVINQSHTPGAQVEPGTAINFTVSLGPPTPDPPGNGE